MRKEIWITGVAILALCIVLAFLLHKRADQSKTIVLDQHEPAQRQAVPNISSNQTNQPQRANVTGTRQASNVLRSLALPPFATPLARAIGETNLYGAHVLALWQTPIEFYGKVVDENSNAVAAAQVSFHWVEVPDETGNRATNTESDADGLFSLLGAAGPSLSVSVSKDGYYPRSGGARYGPADIPKFFADSQNPVIFVLRKKGQGAELIRAKFVARVPKDDTLVRVDFLEKKPSVNGELEISQKKPEFPARGGIIENLSPSDYAKLMSATNWSFRLSIPSGGLVENQDEFQFEAPESGYQSAVEYHFSKGETNWTTQVTKQFYIAFGHPRKYGWVRIESNIRQETVSLTYAINPSGSRNLEPVE